MTTPKKTQNELENTPAAEEVIDGEQSTMLTPDADFNLDEAIEAILFAAGHAVTYTQLGSLFEIPVLEMKSRVLEYAHRYNNSELSRGVILLTYDESCQLCTKPSYLPYIRAALGIRKNGNPLWREFAFDRECGARGCVFAGISAQSGGSLS